MAGRIKRDDIDQLRQRVDVADVIGDHTQLKKAGTRMKGLCPFHQEKTPSFTVDAVRGYYHCFGCGQSGDIFDFLQEIGGLTFTESVEQLARRTGFTLTYEDLSPGQARALGERSKLVEIARATLEFFRDQLYSDDGAIARDYLKDRGFGREDADAFDLGYAPNEWEALSRHLIKAGYAQPDLEKVGVSQRNQRGGLRDRFRGRLIFPVHDASGDVIGFGGRILPGLDYGDFEPPKYYNSPETPLYKKTRVLYGLPQARAEMASADDVLVCEGYTDVMALHQAGFANAVATCGTAVGAEHFRVLSRYVGSVVLAFDGDAAGAKAAERAWQEARIVDNESGGRPFRLRVLTLPDGSDPASFVQEHGVEALRTGVTEASPVVPFLIRRRLAGADPQNDRERAGLLREVVDLLGQEPDLDLRRAWARTEVAVPMDVSLQFVEATAARAGVDLDRHAGADLGMLRSSGRDRRGGIAMVTTEQARRERSVLRAALQHPDWLPDAWFELSSEDFQHPRARQIHEILSEAGGAGVALDSVLETCPDDEARTLVLSVALEDPVGEDTQAVVVEECRTLRAAAVDREVQVAYDELGTINAASDRERFQELNRRILTLEVSRRRLRDQVMDE